MGKLQNECNTAGGSGSANADKLHDSCVWGGVAQASSAPEFRYFASPSDWSQAKLTDDSKAIKVKMGTVPSTVSGASEQPTGSTIGLTVGDPLTWWIVGSNGSYANLYAEKALCRAKFHGSTSSHSYNTSWGCSYSGGAPSEVYANHYGGSDIRNNVMKNLHTQLFKSGEVGIVADSRIECWDNKAGKTYTVTDKMYLPSGGSERENMHSGSSYTTIYVPSSGDTTAGANNQIPLKYWSGGANYNYCWQRSPYNISTYSSLLSLRGAYVYSLSVSHDYAEAAAFKINLSNLSFSSSARSAAATAGQSGGEKLASYEGVHNLRLRDTTNTGSSIKRKGYTEIFVEGAPSSGTYYLMIQGVSGGTDYVFAKKISSGTASIKTSDITATSVTSFENAKVWVEKASETSDGQLLYANALTTVNSSVPNEPTINSTSTSVTYAPGLKLSSVSLPSTSGNTAGSWSWVDGTQSVGDAGTHYFDAKFTPSDTNSYYIVTKSITVTVNKTTLSASNFSYKEPADLINNGSPKEATVTANSDITGIGDITINYYNSSGTKLTSAPTGLGIYTVKIDVAEGTNYKSATGLSNNWGFTVMQMDIGPLYGGSNADIKYGQVATVQALDLPISNDVSSVTYGWYKGSSSDPNSSSWVKLNSELSYRCKKEDVGSYLMFRAIASNGNVYSKVCSKAISATTVTSVSAAKSQIGNGNNGIMVNADAIGINEIQINDVQDLLLASVIVDCGKSDLNIKFNCQNLDMTNQNYIPLGSSKEPYKGKITGNNCTISNYQHGLFTGTINESTKAKLSEISNIYDEYAGLVGNMNKGSITGLTMTNAKLSHKNYVGTFLGFGLDCTIENCNVSGLEITAKGECIGGIAAALAGSRDESNGKMNNCSVSNISKFTAEKIIGGVVGDGYNININNCSCDTAYSVLANNYNCTVT